MRQTNKPRVDTCVCVCVCVCHIQVILELLMSVEVHNTRSERECEYAVLAFVSQILNSMLVLLLVNAAPVRDVTNTSTVRRDMHTHRHTQTRTQARTRARALCTRTEHAEMRMYRHVHACFPMTFVCVCVCVCHRCRGFTT